MSFLDKPPTKHPGPLHAQLHPRGEPGDDSRGVADRRCAGDAAIVFAAALLSLSAAATTPESARAQSIPSAGGGTATASSELGFPDLWDSLDSELQGELRSALQAELPKLLERLSPSGKAGLAVVDITDPYAPLVAEFDGARMNYAASLPKIAILYAAFVEIERGAIVLDAALEDQMTRMVRKSSNEAATAVYHRVGPERIAEILQAEPHRLYNTERNGGLWVGRGYGGETWRQDPIRGVSHGASPMQVARFYYLLATGRLVSPASTEAMLEILSRPGLRHKFVIGLAEDNPDAQLYRKSGTWKNFHADSALVVDPRYSYIAVAIIEDEEGEAILQRLIRLADRTVANRYLD